MQTMIKRVNASQLKRQQGVVLVTSLLILIMVTIVAASAFKTSYIQTLIAGNVKNQTVSFNIAERVLRIAENDIELKLDDPSPFDFAGTDDGYYAFEEDLTVNGVVVNVNEIKWDAITKSQNLNQGIIDGISNGKYIIQYYGQQVDDGGNITKKQNGGAGSGDKVHVFVITARSLDKKRAERIVQSVYVTREMP